MMRELIIAVLHVLMPMLGMAVTAFCIWLGVRIVNEREQWAKRLAVALVVMLVLYVLSFGPMARIEIRRGLSPWQENVFEVVYLPIAWGLNFGPQWVRSSIIWYLHLWDAW